jgi:response regulator RpfG family c-di-GMP phosphodiesterase
MQKSKILVVDDHIEIVKIILHYLKKYNPDFSLYHTTSPTNALNISGSVLPDLIISDWEMPEITGIELIKELKKNPLTKNIPVIISSGIMLTPKNLEIALTAGAYDFIRLPIEPVELSARVNSALRFVSLHKEEIEKKNIELIEKTVCMVKNNEFIIDLQENLEKLKEVCRHNKEAQKITENIIKDIDNKIRQDNWQEFEIAFNSVHSDFTKNLLSNHSNLSPAEIKLCIFIKLGLSIKDTASILCQSTDSLKVARSRLRKKLNIDKCISLQSFMLQY